MSKHKMANRRRRVAEAQNWHCAYCGCGLEPDTATVDHVMPRSCGGRNGWENLVAACEACNKGRKSQPALDYWLARNNLDWTPNIDKLDVFITSFIQVSKKVRKIAFIHRDHGVYMAVKRSA